MPFLARLLLSLSCLAALLSPAAAAGMAAAADRPAQHCQHAEPAEHASHAAGHEHGTGAQDPVACDDCGACANHCMPVLIGTPARLPADWGRVPHTAPPLRLAGITAPPELRPPRL